MSRWNRRSTGTMTGTLFTVALIGFWAGVTLVGIDPVAIGTAVVGGLVAVFLAWRAWRARHLIVERERRRPR